MNPAMVFKGVCSVKSLVANLTPISSLTSVDEPVLVEDGSGEETLSANQALIRALVSVTFTDMIIEIRSDSKAPCTSFDWALEWFNSLMESQMLPQVTGLRVHLSADITQILSISGQSSLLHTLVGVVVVVMDAVLDKIVVHIATDFTANQQLIRKLGVPRVVVVLLVSNK